MKYLKPFGSQSFVVGVGLAALTYLFGPTVKKGARSAAVKGMQGAMVAGETATNAVDTSKEKVSSFFNNVMNRGNHEEHHMTEQQQVFGQMMNEMKQERQENRELMQGMLQTMKSMQEEIHSIKNNSATSSKSNSTATKNNSSTTKKES